MEQALTYYHFPSEHWRAIRTNNPVERILGRYEAHPGWWEPFRTEKVPSC